MHHAVLWQMPSYIRLHTHTKNSLNQEKWRAPTLEDTLNCSEGKVDLRYAWHMGEWVVSHTRMRHTWMSRVTHTKEAHMNESCHDFMRDTSHMCDTSHMNESFRRFERVTHEWVVSWIHELCYGVATVSRIDKITGLFCRIASLL